MLIFATAYTFFQLNVVFIADSRIRFRSEILWKYKLNVRSSHWSCFVKNDVLFTGKHLYWSLFLIESSGLQLFKNVYQSQVIFCGICKIFKNIYFGGNLRTTASEANWYIWFSFCNRIYSFICQFFFRYYWYCYNQNSRPVVFCKKRFSYKFHKNHKKAPALNTRF